MVFVVEQRPEAWSRSTRPTACSTCDGELGSAVAHRRLQHLPRVPRQALSRSRCSAVLASAAVLDVRVHDPRDCTPPTATAASTTRRSAGVPGMVMAPEPLFAAVEAADPVRPLLLLSAERPALRPDGRARARRPAPASRWCAVATRASTSVSPTTCATASSRSATSCSPAARLPHSSSSRRWRRLVPGVMGNDDSAADESFTDGLLEYPQYTRPADFRGHAVPEVLRSGDHARIARWRRAQALRRTLERRPDLLDPAGGPGAVDRRSSTSSPTERCALP